mmetsp:Transcript_738/g.1796  ORF Transcript_738/g.1796 Transcript_738/m.1796 type:complete len:184 (-) Transcript_738:67-618(-)
MAAAAWNELKRLRHRDLLRGALLNAFEQDQLECRVIQSAKFRPVLSRWVDVLTATGSRPHAGVACQEVDPQSVPAEAQQAAKDSKDPEVRWLVKRLLSGDRMHRGPAHYPSNYLQKGPQFPFQPWEFNYLKTRTGSIRGTELLTKIELPKVKAPPPVDPRPRDLWAEGCLDDADLADFRKPAK